MIDVQEWEMPDPVDKTERCTHGRPLNGNPCKECPCPGRSVGKEHSFLKILSLGTCLYCKALGSGAIPRLSVLEQIGALGRQAEEQES